jgi:transposase
MKRGKWVLSESEARQLSELSSRGGRHGARAQLVMLSATGRSASAVAEQLGVTVPTVYKWRKRYLQGGLAGLCDRARPGQPRRLSLARRNELARATREELPGAGRRWTIRLLARQLGVTQHQVRMIWREHGLSRHVVTPRLVEATAGESVALRGLFIQPPLSAIALAVEPGGRPAREPVLPVARPASSPLRAVHRLAARPQGADLTDTIANLHAFVVSACDGLSPRARLELVFANGTVFGVANLVHGLSLAQGIRVSAWARTDAWLDSIELWLAQQELESAGAVMKHLAAEVVRYLESNQGDPPFAFVAGRSQLGELRNAVEGGSRPDSARLRGLSLPRAPH